MRVIDHKPLDGRCIPRDTLDLASAKNQNNCGNICFDCEKAVGKCPWSAYDKDTDTIRYEPIPGWTAEKTELCIGSQNLDYRIVDTYRITACPLFEPTPPRRQSNLMLTEEQSRLFLEGVGRE